MAIYLKNLRLLKDHRNLHPFSVRFKDGMNIIVGENGSGKSTLLDLIIGRHKKDLIKVNFEKGSTYRFLDTEKHNPRTKTDCSGSGNIMFEVSSRFMSHGETMLLLLEGSKSFKDILLIVDEPETGISIKNQIKVLKILKNLTDKSNCQVILATHSYHIIKTEEKIFSMDLMAWVNSEKYLQSVIQ